MPFKGQKRAKIGLKEGPKYKIVYCKAKQDFKVFKIHNWDVKLVCYVKESNRSIFLSAVRLNGLRAKKSKI